jgi:hypothetical protein
VTGIDTSFMQNIFNLAKAERIPNVTYYRQADEFRGSFKVFEDILCCHLPKLGINRGTVKFI